MIATIIPDVRNHYPVLLSEIISIITPQYGGTFIDCTFGQGGYTKKILNFPETKVIALDRDSESSIKAQELQNSFEDRLLFKNIKFSQLNNLKLKHENIKAVIFDLGYSLNQIKDPKKGLSFDSIGELNMKMGINEFSAKEAINQLDEKELTKIFKYFGDEADSKRIAHNIVEDRSKREITTEELVRIIESSKRKRNYKTHSATKIFQALRIFVNKEISELIYGLINAAKVVKKDGVIAVVTFHSLEDKIVKLRMPNATRPWTYVLDIVYGYLQLAAHLKQKTIPSGQSWNFASGEIFTVKDIAESLITPFKDVSIICDATSIGKEVEQLQISADKVFKYFQWQPKKEISVRLKQTADWYKMQSLKTGSQSMSNIMLNEYLK